MNLLIAAVAAGLVLLWGGTLAILRPVPPAERRRLLLLAGYATLVAGSVIGLVLFAARERQLEHRRELDQQMAAVTRSLEQLSDRLLGQLEEKANLTASEFEVRARLQGEKEQHERTRSELDRAYQGLEQERQSRQTYEAQQDQRAAERVRSEEERYQRLSGALAGQERSIEGLRAQLTALQSETGRLTAQSAGLSGSLGNLLEAVRALQRSIEQDGQRLEALARGQAALARDLTAAKAQVDSLYRWK